MSRTRCLILSTIVCFSFFLAITRCDAQSLGTLANELGTNDVRLSDMGANGSVLHSASAPAIAYNSTNNEYLVVWSGDDDVDGEYEIYGQRIDATTGAEVGTNDFRISDMGPNGSTTYGAFSPAVAYNSTNNEYLVVWYGDDNSGSLADDEFEIYGQRINAATGAEVGTDDFRISDMGTDGDFTRSALFPALAHNRTNNEYLVVWHGIESGGTYGSAEMEIFGQRIKGSDGTELGTNDLRISDMGQDGVNSTAAAFPAVAWGSAYNRYLVVWQGNDASGSMAETELEIYSQLLEGATLADAGLLPDIRLSDMGPDGDANYNALTPSVAYNSAQQRFLVVWAGDDNSGALVNEEFEIYGQVVSEIFGMPTGTNDFRISDMGPDGSAAYQAFRPQVSFGSTSEDFVVTWYASDNTGALVPFENEIYAQHLDAYCSEIGTNDIRISDMGPDGNAEYGAGYHGIAFNSTNNEFYIAWAGDDNTSPLVDDELEIFGQQLEISQASPAPSTPDMTAATDTGTSNTDNITSNLRPTFTGTASTGDTVYISGLHTSGSILLGSSVASDGTYTITPTADLPDGQIVLIAYSLDPDGNLSDLSSLLAIEVQWPDTDGDGTDDYSDTDDDNDEVSDSQEQTDGTDPQDSGSYLVRLGEETFSPWNSNLGLWNVSEIINLDASYSATVDLRLLNSTGVVAGGDFSAGFHVGARQEVDYLVHGFGAFAPNSYGLVRNYVSAVDNNYDGRMVHYHTTNGAIDFAFAMPFDSGLSGAQYVPFNTYQPSLDPTDANNVVANWISLTNLTATAQSGVLLFFAQDGSTLSAERLTLNSLVRQDISGHQFGANKVGLVMWQPDSLTAKFQLRNIRYLYDNATLVNSFDSAFQLDGLRGSNQTLVVPLDTTDGSSIIELANTDSSAVTYDLTIYNAAGNVIETQSGQLEPHATVHVIADLVLPSAIGSATIAARNSGKLIATVMQYGRNETAGIDYLYGLSARQALGSELNGSYNTYLGQSCTLQLINPTASTVSGTFSMTRNDGTSVLSPTDFSVPAHGIVQDNLCTRESTNYFGIVTVSAATNNAISSNVIRVGPNNRYRFPTLMR